MTINALLVEDDVDLSAALIDLLEIEGIHCDYATNGRSGLQLAQSNPYDVLIVDVSMPVMNGLSLCEVLRADGCAVPLLMLTARDTLDDKLAGFDAGADDYLTKPFAAEELVARIRALAGRRSAQARRQVVGDLVVDYDRQRAERNGRTLDLTPTSWRLLEALAKVSPSTLPYQALYLAGWGEDMPSKNSFDVQLYKLRRAVDQPGESPMLHTVTGIGVRLGADGV
ncbi:MAG: response regulator transcription factor [Pseudomonadota bacterium]